MKLSFSSELCCALFILLIISCGIQSPAIKSLEYRIELHTATSYPDVNSYESLSVFALVDNIEDTNDVDEIWVLQNDTFLSWKLDKSNWYNTKESGNVWIGASPITMNDLSNLPRGQYTYTLISSTGKKASSNFYIINYPYPNPKPILKISKGIITISNSWPESMLILYDSAGGVLDKKLAPGGTSPLEAAIYPYQKNQISKIVLYGYDPSSRFATISPALLIK